MPADLGTETGHSSTPGVPGCATALSQWQGSWTSMDEYMGKAAAAETGMPQDRAAGKPGKKALRGPVWPLAFIQRETGSHCRVGKE